jgi:hypothetical protein
MNGKARFMLTRRKKLIANNLNTRRAIAASAPNIIFIPAIAIIAPAKPPLPGNTSMPHYNKTPIASLSGPWQVIFWEEINPLLLQVNHANINR